MLVSCEEINHSFDRARQIFSDMLFPAQREALINKARESDVRKDVVQALSYIPERQYLNAGDATGTVDVIQNIVQPFVCLDYPVAKEQLIEAARDYNSPGYVMGGLENCPDKTYDSFIDVVNCCGGMFKW